MKSITLVLSICSFLFLIACKKEKEECTEKIKHLSFWEPNEPVVVGWPLVIFAQNYGKNGIYRWKGPNGWSTETTYDVDNYEPHKIIKDSASFNDAGNYTVEYIEDGCTMAQGGINVQVIAPPMPPCSIPNNSSTTTLGGVGGTSYNSISHSGGIYYSVYASGAINQTITFTFKGTPKPGMYLTNPGNHPTAPDRATVHIQSGYTDFFIKSSYTVYVNEVNGKLQFSFCNAHFNNPVGDDDIIISAKLTLP